jgi:protein gp37
MGADTKIQWATHTFNPWRGCTKVSQGCANCCAEKLSNRNPLTLGVWGPNGTRVVAGESMWEEPGKWNKAAACKCDDANGTCNTCLNGPPRVFCASLADVFEEWQGNVHTTEKLEGGGNAVAWYRSDIGVCRAGQTTIERVRGERLATLDDVRLKLIRTFMPLENLDLLLLTKRPENVLPMLDRILKNVSECESEEIADWFRERVWLGTSVENQAAKTRVDILRAIPAAVRFLSVEPLLEDLGTLDLSGIGWVIVGGESGTGARPMHPGWARSIRDQCHASGVPYFFKQWGEYLPHECVPVDSNLHIEPPIDAALFDSLRIFQDGIAAEIEDGTSTGEVFKPGNLLLSKVGKEAAGRTLDGREWSEFPAIEPR